MQENWSVDIPGGLDEFLNLIDAADDADVNFRQAGMIVLGSSQVYSRKVEFLKNLVFQRMDSFIRLKNKRNASASSINEDGRDLDAVFANEGEATLLTLDWPVTQQQAAVNVDDRAPPGSAADLATRAHLSSNLHSMDAGEYVPYHALRQAQLQPRPPIALLSLDPTRLLPNRKVPSSGFKIANLVMHSSGALLLQESDRRAANPLARSSGRNGEGPGGFGGGDRPFGSPSNVMRAQHLGVMMVHRLGGGEVGDDGQRVVRQLPFNFIGGGAGGAYEDGDEDDYEGYDAEVALMGQQSAHQQQQDGLDGLDDLPAPDHDNGDHDDYDDGGGHHEHDDGNMLDGGDNGDGGVLGAGAMGYYAGAASYATVAMTTGVSPGLGTSASAAVAAAATAGAAATGLLLTHNDDSNSSSSSSASVAQASVEAALASAKRAQEAAAQAAVEAEASGTAAARRKADIANQAAAAATLAATEAQTIAAEAAAHKLAQLQQQQLSAARPMARIEGPSLPPAIESVLASVMQSQSAGSARLETLADAEESRANEALLRPVRRAPLPVPPASILSHAAVPRELEAAHTVATLTGVSLQQQQQQAAAASAAASSSGSGSSSSSSSSSSGRLLLAASAAAGVAAARAAPAGVGAVDGLFLQMVARNTARAPFSTEFASEYTRNATEKQRAVRAAARANSSRKRAAAAAASAGGASGVGPSGGGGVDAQLSATAGVRADLPQPAAVRGAADTSSDAAAAATAAAAAGSASAGAEVGLEDLDASFIAPPASTGALGTAAGASVAAGAGAAGDFDALLDANGPMGGGDDGGFGAGFDDDYDDFDFNPTGTGVIAGVRGAGGHRHDDDDDDEALSALSALTAAAAAPADPTRNAFLSPSAASLSSSSSASAGASSDDTLLWAALESDNIADAVSAARGLSGAGAAHGSVGAGQMVEAAAVSYSALVRREVEQYLSLSDRYMGQTKLAARVRGWETRLEPVLRAEDGRRSFDIFEYGTTVMRGIQQGAPPPVPLTRAEEDAEKARIATAAAKTSAAAVVQQQQRADAAAAAAAEAAGEVKRDAKDEKPVLSFADAFRGQPRWEVCRGFLAALQLANSGNVDIVPTPEGYVHNGPVPEDHSNSDSSSGSSSARVKIEGGSDRASRSSASASASAAATGAAVNGEQSLRAPGSVCFKLITTAGRVREEIGTFRRTKSINE